MQKESLIQYFGSTHKLAAALNVNQSAIVRWQDTVPTKQVKRLAQVVDREFLQVFGSTLIDNGYKIVPIKQGSKRPSLKDWTHIDATHGDVDKWTSQGFKGVGILCEYTPAIDIDVRDQKIVEELTQLIEKECGKVILKRVGNAPKVIIPFRSEAVFTKQISNAYLDNDKQSHRIEVLGKGQQFVAFAQHPDTKQPYQWTSEDSLLTAPANQLPILTQELIDKVFDHFKSIVPSDWKKVKSTAETLKGALEQVKAKPNITEEQLTEALQVIPAEDYETWLKVGMALYEHYDGQARGLTLWDEWSAQAANYNAEAIKTKWQSFKTSDLMGNAVTAKTILALAAKSHNDKLEEKIKAFYQYHYYVASEDAILDTRLAKHKDPLPLTNFYNSNLNFYRLEANDKGVIKRIQIAKEWMNDRKRKTVTRRDYRPDKPEFFKDVDGENCYNTFYWPEHKKLSTEVDLTLFYQHLALLFPIEKEREWFLDWMAFTIQAPHIRSPITPLHINLQHGLGRGLLAKLLRALVGRHNVGKCDIDHFGNGSKGQFNDYLFNNILCIMEEMDDGMKHYKIADKIKSVLTDDDQRASIKYKQGKDLISYTNFLFFSNNLTALKLTEEDRRFNVFISDTTPKEEQYYINIAKWLDRKEVIADIFNTLKTRPLDIDAFKGQKPMKNEAKKRLIREGKSETELVLDDFLVNPPAEWMTFQQIKKHLDGGLDDFDSPINVQQLKLLLKRSRLTYKPDVHQIKIKGKLYSHWCLTTTARHWDNDQIREEILKHTL
ncbi:Cro/CI family transcriptional regulator [Cysteiniphilum halobium]|uniref:Cro/CI family transcriptional regulator n=1 Tax=Cysteiniphilum halobium TaxID=2219059 RepID=UPI003F82B732